MTTAPVSPALATTIRVITAHQPLKGIRDLRRHCTCGWASTEDDNSATAFIHHQANALFTAEDDPTP